MAPLLQPALDQSVLIQAQIVSYLMQECRMDFFAIRFLIGLSLFPNVFQKQDDLRRQRRKRSSFVGEVWPDKQSKCVGLDAIAALGGIGPPLEGDWQGLCAFTQ